MASLKGFVNPNAYGQKAIIVPLLVAIILAAGRTVLDMGRLSESVSAFLVKTDQNSRPRIDAV